MSEPKHISPFLLRALGFLGDEYGPLSTALAAADLTDLHALLNVLQGDRPPTDQPQMPTDVSPDRDQPLLGLATTEELFREIIARFAMAGRYPGPVERALVLAEMLGNLSAADREYRTVDSE